MTTSGLSKLQEMTIGQQLVFSGNCLCKEAELNEENRPQYIMYNSTHHERKTSEKYIEILSQKIIYTMWIDREKSLETHFKTTRNIA